MKVSLNWIFDHINGDVCSVDVSKLVSTFIKKTAEIEGWRHVSFNPDACTLVQVTDVFDNQVSVHSSEWNKQYTLPLRSDIQKNSWYLVEYKNDSLVWAAISSLGGTKDTLLPALSVEESFQAGGWKKHIECSDYIIDIDNKSINHRPDLWGHRGIAREVAALLDLPLKNIDSFIAQQKMASNEKLQGNTGAFSVRIEDHQTCQRFAALHIDSIENRYSDLGMVIRLSRLDSRSIDYIVDCTNYTMLDLGHPMHAFDAQSLSSKNIAVRRARAKEKLTLLDNETIELSSHDVVIADGSDAVSLAGVMGGAATGVTAKTTSLLLEAAHFDAATIRRTAARYKKRTEASMRFEKSLDPNHLDTVILRFLFLLSQAGIAYETSAELVVLGHENKINTIDVAHARIEQLLGTTVSTDKVCTLLEHLDFSVEKKVVNGELSYSVRIPSFRATKDVAIEEDIIEEIGRYIGYDSIAAHMPLSRIKPSDLHNTYTTRAIKRLLSNGLLMRELYGYSFFDESFLYELGWGPDESVELKNPISENYTRMVTTLQPHMLKAVKDNSVHHSQLRFYEWGRVWHGNNDEFVEKKSLSGIFFDQTKALDFYEGKALVSRLFKELSCDIVWQRTDDSGCYPWLSLHQTAMIMHNGNPIGKAGMLQEHVVSLLSAAGGTAFMFECDGDYLLQYKRPVTRFVPLSKYPAVLRDVSIMIPLSVTVDTLLDTIKKIDSRVKNVSLIDFFTKKEWHDQKSLTFHVEMRDDTKTLEHDEVERLWDAITAALKNKGAVIR